MVHFSVHECPPSNFKCDGSHVVLRMERQEAASIPDSSRAAPGGSFLRVVRLWARLTKLWFTGPERATAVKLCGTTLVLSVALTSLLLHFSYVQSSLQSGLSEKNADAFYAGVRSFALIILLAAPLFAATDWVDSLIVVHWRQWLGAELVRAYFADRAFYRLKLLHAREVDNPDERMCDDVRAFTDASVTLLVALVRKLVNLAVFSRLLYGLAPDLALFLLFYAALGTLVTSRVFGRRLAALTYASSAREADLRFALVHAREAAEAVAFYRGEAREARGALGALDAATGVRLRLAGVGACLSLWTQAYSLATLLLPSLLMAPRFFAGHARFGDIAQVSYAFARVETALSFAVDHLGSLTQLAAQTERLWELVQALQSEALADGGARERAPLPGGSGDGLLAMLKKQTPLEGEEALGRASPRGEVQDPLSQIDYRLLEGDGSQGCVLHVDGLSLSTPGCAPRLVVCRDLALSMQASERLLIVGPSGCGKSSLLRALAGLWTRGEGTVGMLSPQHVLFLPQRPYMCLGSLRAQLLFPRDASEEEGFFRKDESRSLHRRRDDVPSPLASSCAWGPALRALCPPLLFRAPAAAAKPSVFCSSSSAPPSDVILAQVLARVGLSRLLQSPGGLDAADDWAAVLSLGEQQRIAVARALLSRPGEGAWEARGCAPLVLLDEATSALDEEAQAALYDALCARGAALVSVGHRPSLLRWHSAVLRGLGQGRWVLLSAAQYRTQLARREEEGR